MRKFSASASPGLSIRQIAQEFAMPVHAVNAAIDRNLPQIDAPIVDARSRCRCCELHEVFHPVQLVENTREKFTAALDRALARLCGKD
jgi:hypothetical protein